MEKIKRINIRKRVFYALSVFVVIAVGILSRKIAVVPLIVGDVLYAVMMFLLIKFLLIQLRYCKVALISLSICYFIEIGQLYQAPWINRIRSSTLGALVLGKGFLWSDMIAYTVGTAICLLFLYFVRLGSRRNSRKRDF